MASVAGFTTTGALLTKRTQSSVFGAVGCCRAGETAGILLFAADAVLDRSFGQHPALGRRRDRSSPWQVSGAVGFAGAMPDGPPRW
jgi:hypothetical protein